MDERNRKQLAQRIISGIFDAMRSFENRTYSDPEHITISVDDFYDLQCLCMVTASQDEEGKAKNKIMGMDCSISRNLKRGELVIGMKYQIAPAVYQEELWKR